MRARYVVIGGGISGLSAAYALMSKRPASEIILLEAGRRIGGVIETDRHAGFVMEGGPDSILRRKPEALRMAESLGLQTIGANPGAHGASIYYRHRFFPIPPGVQAGIPTDVKGLAQSRLLSWPGKMRAGLDFILPRITQPDQDISLGRFLRYRFGDEVVDRLAGPMLAGIYAGDINQMSLEATFPQFKQMEQDYRSVVLGARRRQHPAQKQTKSVFASFPEGLESLIEKLSQTLSHIDIRVNAPVLHLESGPDHTVRVVMQGHIIEADGVVLAVPAFVAARILKDISSMVSHVLEEITYPNLAVIGAIYKPGQIKTADDKTGFLVPHQQELKMTACTYVSSKWHYPGVPEGTVIRAFYGRADQDILTMTDEDLTALYIQEMTSVFPALGHPWYLRVFRHPQAIPQYQVGHSRRIGAALVQLRAQSPRVALAGSYIEGVGIPDCVRRAYAAVNELAES